MQRTSHRHEPSVLLVDDHRGVRDQVAAVLAGEFHVIGIASDGEEGVALARQLAPDVIVLDINMPGLDGYQTKRALDQAGCAAPVVFLSMFDSTAHVSEAFACGGRGYVLKPRVTRDLARALRQALRGGIFVPSLASLAPLATGGGHAAQMYRDHEAFLDGVAGAFDLALRRGEATCVIATPDIRLGLSERLRARGWDVGPGAVQRRYLVVDAADALRRVMTDGVPDRARLEDVALELDQYRRSVGDGATRLTVVGNIATILSAAGNANGVVAFERAWDSLTRDLPFFTLCGYAASCFHDAPERWSDVCAEHWAVSHA